LSSTGQLVVAVDPATGAETTLAQGYGPVWSPDGSRIAYSDAANRLAVMHADGSSPRELSDLQSNGPAWSPEGSRVVFAGVLVDTSQAPSRFGYPTRADLYTVAADGSGAPRRITGPFDQDFAGFAVGAPVVLARRERDPVPHGQCAFGDERRRHLPPAAAGALGNRRRARSGARALSRRS
jgi:eukaryotic-like serine/threonine-protein kinase